MLSVINRKITKNNRFKNCAETPCAETLCAELFARERVLPCAMTSKVKGQGRKVT